MKKVIATILLVLSINAVVKAQTTNITFTNYPTVLGTNVNPFTMIYQYFTSFNTNLQTTFATNNNYEAWLGASYQNDTFLGGVVGFEAQPLSVFRPLTLRTAATLGAQVGTLADWDFNLGYSFVHIDTRVTPFIGGDLINRAGVANQPQSFCFDYGVEVQKAMSQNTFAGMFVEGRTRTKGALVIGFETGVTF